jgi:hypothetical protein
LVVLNSDHYSAARLQQAASKGEMFAGWTAVPVPVPVLVLARHDEFALHPTVSHDWVR